ncbi:MAG: CHAT domain-containing protein [Theionarchaea archaeon]|nr:CHAT domain-containing protein [Theionarchaea archaeon]
MVRQENLGSPITSADMGQKSMIIGTDLATFILSLSGTKRTQQASDPVRAVAMSENDSCAISGTKKNIFLFPSPESTTQINVETPVNYVSISSSGNRAGAATSDIVYFFSIEEEITYRNYQIPSITFLQISRDGHFLTVGTEEGSLHVLGESDELFRKEGLQGSITSVALSDTMIVAGTSEKMYFFDMMGRELINFPVEGMVDCDISHDGKFIVAADTQGLHVFNEKGEILWQKSVDIKTVEISKDGSHITAVSESGILFFLQWKNTFEGTNYYPYSSGEFYSFQDFQQVWTYPISPVGEVYTEQPLTRVAVGDVNGDGKNEIVASTGSEVVVLDSEMNVLWEKNYTKDIVCVTLLDVNNDTVPEVVYPLRDGQYNLSFVDMRKDEVTEVNFMSYFGVSYEGLKERFMIPVVSYDIDDDTRTEILAVINSGYPGSPRGVLAFEYPSGEVEWFYSTGPLVVIEAIYDINGDGEPEIILGSRSPCNGNQTKDQDDCHVYLMVLTLEGEELWSEEISEGFKILQVGVEDLDNDGTIEIIGTVIDSGGNMYGKLLVRDCEGRALYDEEFSYSLLLGGLADIDGNGFKEIVVTTSEGDIVVYDFRFSLVNRSTIKPSLQSRVAAINDIDGDGNEEIMMYLWDKRAIILNNNLVEEWSKSFESIPDVLVTNVSGCGNDLLILTQKTLNLYSFGEEDFLCGKLVSSSSLQTPAPMTEPRGFIPGNWLPFIISMILVVISLLFLRKFIRKREVPDLMILSLEKRDKTLYQVSLESVRGAIHPVKSAHTIDISPDVRSEMIARIDCASKVINTFLSLGKEPKKTVNELERMGTVIYKNFIPRDFAQKLVNHYLVLDVEDVQIPWELMYDGEFFALKYAVSRRIKSEKVPEIHLLGKREKKALLIADPTERLPGAVRECEYLKDHLQGYFTSIYLKPEKARKVDIMYHFSQKYDIIHYAGELDKNNCLPVYKGELTCAEIERTLEGSPVVFINGCCSAKAFSYDIEGLAKTFLERGALSFIGSLWGIHDRTAAEIAAEFYKNCLKYPVGEALRLSRKKYYSIEDITWAAFVMYGDPTLNLFK